MIRTLVTGLNLTEGPRPDGRGNIYFTDVFGRGLYRWDRDEKCVPLGPDRQSSGGCVLNGDGRVVFSGRDGLMMFDPVSGNSTSLPARLDGRPVRGINDIEADAQGNLWGGTIDHGAFERGEPPSPGMLFRLSCRDGTLRRMATVAVPNGMDFSADGRTLYLSETGEGIFAYDVGGDGALSGRRMVAGPLADSDGIVLDAAGGLWVACYLGNTLVHYRPDGVVDRTVELPFASITSAAFGGDDWRTLYVTGGSLTETGTGGLLCLRTDVPGRAPFTTGFP